MYYTKYNYITAQLPVHSISY